MGRSGLLWKRLVALEAEVVALPVPIPARDRRLLVSFFRACVSGREPLLAERRAAARHLRPIWETADLSWMEELSLEELRAVATRTLPGEE